MSIMGDRQVMESIHTMELCPALGKKESLTPEVVMVRNEQVTE